MKKIFMIILLLVLISCSKESNTNKSTLNKDEIIVGMELQFPPFETIDKNGKPYGISVDIADALGEYLGKKVRIEEIAYSGLIPALTSRKIDVIISSLSITEPRKKQMDFSDPYGSGYLSLLIYTNSAVMSHKDLNNDGVKIAVKKGTIGQIYAEDNFKNAQILPFEKDSEAVLEVAQGKADVFIYDVYSVYKNHLEYPNNTRVALLPADNNESTMWGIGIRRNDTELKEQINMFLASYNESEAKNESINKHFADVRAYFNELGIPFFIK
jgi:polar amino acid transport system substrate-binding protein